MRIINPATAETVDEVKADTAETLRAKTETLQKGQAAWAETPLSERLGAIRRFHALLDRDKERLAADLTREVGKPLRQSYNELNGARARVEWMCSHAEKYLCDEVMSQSEDMKELIRYEPLGLVCNISAWNYPYLVGMNVIVPALLAGNAVLYKPSEFAVMSGLNIAGLLWEAGVPEQVFQIGVGAADIGEALLHLPFDGYFFTGSYHTGRHVYETVAPRMVVCQCELGGKDPLYVTDDITDLRAVAIGTADGAFYNNGQSCCAVERIYVHEKVYDEYIRYFKEEVDSWKMGDPMEDGVYLGPITRPANLETLAGQVEDAIAKGAKLLTGGKRADRKGYYFQPTVLTDVDHSMKVMRDESFGPIIGIMKVSGDAEALRRMQDTEYGLTASVYCADESRARSILSRIDAGTGYVNCCDRVSAALPWSGRRHSGFGATLSHQGLRAFTRVKAYHLRKG